MGHIIFKLYTTIECQGLKSFHVTHLVCQICIL